MDNLDPSEWSLARIPPSGTWHVLCFEIEFLPTIIGCHISLSPVVGVWFLFSNLNPSGPARRWITSSGYLLWSPATFNNSPATTLLSSIAFGDLPATLVQPQATASYKTPPPGKKKFLNTNVCSIRVSRIFLFFFLKRKILVCKKEN